MRPGFESPWGRHLSNVGLARSRSCRRSRRRRRDKGHPLLLDPCSDSLNDSIRKKLDGNRACTAATCASADSTKCLIRSHRSGVPVRRAGSCQCRYTICRWWHTNVTRVQLRLSKRRVAVDQPSGPTCRRAHIRCQRHRICRLISLRTSNDVASGRSSVRAPSQRNGPAALRPRRCLRCKRWMLGCVAGVDGQGDAGDIAAAFSQQKLDAARHIARIRHALERTAPCDLLAMRLVEF